MSHLETRNPAPPASGNRANELQFTASFSTAKPKEALDFSALYLANRYRLPMRVAALFTWFAELGRAL